MQKHFLFTLFKLTISLLRGRTLRNWVIEFRPCNETQYLHVQGTEVLKILTVEGQITTLPRTVEIIFYPVMHHVSEDRRPQPHRYEHL